MRGATANVRYEARLWAAQRISAAVVAICVAVHLATIVIAVRGGLSAAEILGRTRGSTAWLVFYVVFVLAAAIHAPIGLRAIVREMTAWRGRSLEAASATVAIGLAILGWQAVRGLFL